MSCKFIGQLSRLRKLSAESVENTNTFDLFKEYLHVERQVEIELRDLLRNINANQEKCLVLLCGSAGDGKSHLISYLKNSDDEGLLNNFEPYNDATESSEPTLTSIDTLAEKLSSFNDDNLDSNDGKKMIIAINLGTLNNFIDSEKGKNFRKLKHYVLNNGIFSGYGQSGGYQVGSVFQHVSFSDYQVFSLGSNGIETTFLDLLFKKVFQKESNNPFYTSYDILKTRSNESDVEATRFHSLENIKEVFEKATDNTPYHVLNNLTDISVLGGIKPDLKKIIYRFIARINDFGANRKDTTSQIRLREFIQYLYFQNSGNEKKLGELYKSTRRAILGWNGQFEDDYICIDDTNDQLWLLEQLQIKSVINKNAQKNNGRVILIDEFEKCDKQVQNFFLQLLEDGIFTDSLGRDYDLDKYIIIFTANLPAEDVSKKLSRELISRFNLKYSLSKLTEEEKKLYVKKRATSIVEDVYTKFGLNIKTETETVIEQIDVANYDNMRDINNIIMNKISELLYPHIYK